jgi:uncharacterized protein YbjQ (UPF0145 family)
VPLFHRKSDEEKQQEEAGLRLRAEAQTEAEASLASLQRGGIPIPAQRRLDKLRAGGGKVFTSDLSVNEFLLARQVGVDPITQVMGSSVYHVGWQNINWQYMSGEMTVISRAFTEARLLALGRMAEEAQRVGANVVVGVHIKSGHFIPGERLVEFQAFGTAAMAAGAPAASQPVLTNLSGQDFWKLYSSGYWPLGVAAGSTVYHAVASWAQQMSTGMFGGWQNQEMPDFTTGLYQARGIALSRVQAEAMRHEGAEGLVGVSLEQEQEQIEVSGMGQNERRDMLFTFHVIGTSVAKLDTDRRPKFFSAIDLRS